MESAGAVRHGHRPKGERLGNRKSNVFDYSLMAGSSSKASALIDTRVIYCGDNLDQLRKLPEACVNLIYTGDRGKPVRHAQSGEAVSERTERINDPPSTRTATTKSSGRDHESNKAYKCACATRPAASSSSRIKSSFFPVRSCPKLPI